MSVEKYKAPNGEEYPIGEIGWEGANTISELFDAVIPTYGLWGGPGWAGGVRVPKGTEISWNLTACYNDTIRTCTDLENESQYHYSLVGAITKKHDWEYYRAERSAQGEKPGSENNNEIVMKADMALLQTMSEVSAQLQETGAAAYECLVPGYEKEYVYIGQLDAAESKYAKMISAAFAIKITMWDAAKTLWSKAVGFFKNIFSGSGEETSEDSTSAVSAKKDTDALVYTCYDKVTRTEKGWTLGFDTEYACKLPEVIFGAGSTRPADTFQYMGNNMCTVYGGSGKDKIVVSDNGSHQAQLVLKGGEDKDTYYLAYGSGNHTISDSGDNLVFWEGRKLGSFYKEGSENVWKTFDQKNQISHASPWKITFEDGTTITLEEGSNPDDFGINLIDVPDNPATTLTITGDLAPVDFDPDTPGVQTRVDELGNIITDPGTQDTGRADTLYDSTGNDSITGGGGNDQILADKGGDDWLNGGEGSDGIVAGSGRDILEGGTGADLLFGGTDDDRLFAEEMGEMSDLVEAGETAVGMNGQGDFLSGGEGNDFLYGSDRSDALFGGAGSDLLVGGGGNDVILGAGHAGAALFDWSYSIETSANPSGGTAYQPVFTNVAYQSVLTEDTGNDVVYAGTGDDFVYTGNGNDEIYGGEGNDTVFGWGGADYIEGGSGDDVLSGDNTLSELAMESHGDDYIDGGEGNDTIRGYGGSDDLYGGAGNDELYGDSSDIAVALHGNDYIDGEEGDDLIFGMGGDDILFGGEGIDTIYGSEGSDEIYGGAGNDLIAGDASEADVSLHGNDYIDGGEGDDLAVGYGGDDTIMRMSRYNEKILKINGKVLLKEKIFRECLSSALLGGRTCFIE